MELGTSKNAGSMLSTTSWAQEIVVLGIDAVIDDFAC